MSNKQPQGRLFFYAIFILLALATLYLISPFIHVILISLVAVVTLKPVYNFFIRRRIIKGRRGIATTLTILCFMLVLVIPICIIGYALISQLDSIVNSIVSGEIDLSFESLIDEIEAFFAQIPALSDFQLDPEAILEALESISIAIKSWLASLAVAFGTTIPGLVMGFFIFLVLVSTLLPAFDEFRDYVNQLSPLDQDITRIFGNKSIAMIKSMVSGVFLMAIIGGGIMGVFYWLAGVPFVLFWTFLSMMFGILPIVGISFIALPLAVVLLLVGETWSAVIVLFGFYIIVNPMDIWLRPRLVSKEAYINFVLILLAIIGGAYLGGLLGMIYGPVIMILFVTTLQIYREHFRDKRDKSSAISLDNGDPETLLESNNQAEDDNPPELAPGVSSSEG